MTASSIDEARVIARALVDERLAACCTIVPAVESVYRWEGVVEVAAETLVMVKTTGEMFPELKERIEVLHSYDVPEIIAIPIVAGSEQYLKWIGEQVGGR